PFKYQVGRDLEPADLFGELQFGRWMRSSEAVTVLRRHRRASRAGIECGGEARAVAGDAAVFEAGAGVGVGFVHPGDGPGVAVFAGEVGDRVGGVAGGEAFDAGTDAFVTEFVRAEDVDGVEIHREAAAGEADLS